MSIETTFADFVIEPLPADPRFFAEQLERIGNAPALLRITQCVSASPGDAGAVRFLPYRVTGGSLLTVIASAYKPSADQFEGQFIGLNTLRARLANGWAVWVREPALRPGDYGARHWLVTMRGASPDGVPVLALAARKACAAEVDAAELRALTVAQVQAEERAVQTWRASKAAELQREQAEAASREAERARRLAEEERQVRETARATVARGA